MTVMSSAVKIEVMEHNDNAPGRDPERPEPHIWTLDKDSRWTSVPVGPPPIVGYQNSEL